MNPACPHCQLLATTLETIKARYGDKIAILEVVLPPDNQATIAKYRSTHKVTAPIICDQGQMTASYFNATPSTMQHIYVPHLFVIDNQGIIPNDFTYQQTPPPIFQAPA